MLVDTHIHADLYDNPERIIDQIEKNNITAIIVTNLPSYYSQALQHLGVRKRIRVAVGYHPLYIDKSSNQIELFRKYASSSSFIGEVGLDFSNDGISTKDIQIKVFSQILDTINNRTRFISIHSRKAEGYVLKMLLERSIHNAIFHWYSGDIKTLDSIVDSGYYVSVNSAMLYSSMGRKIIDRIPKERILTETDGPFTRFDKGIIEPINIRNITSMLSNAWRCNVKNTEEQVWANFMRIMNSIHQEQVTNISCFS